MTCVELLGPPPVITCTKINDPFKVVITIYKMEILICGQTRGTVIRQNCCHSEHPSISAASYISLLTLAMPPISININNPIPAQTEGSTILGNAHFSSPSHGFVSTSKPMNSSPLLM